ncbi:uncharacterized protein [Epargyreus clarus]|uniref:uncharacterized protein n=1 Tax=Epargyreus clarus TaxID=520877 RepID=UPI003C2D7D55
MAKIVDLQAVVKHIVNGSFSDSLCRICLLPLGECYEDVFTKVCKEDREYCIADILETICKVKITYSERYKVCSECFFEASSAYKFYLLSKRTEEILKNYVNLLYQHIGSLEAPEESSSDSICIKLPIIEPKTDLFDYDLTGMCLHSNDKQFEDLQLDNDDKKLVAELENKVGKVEKYDIPESQTKVKSENTNDDDLVVVFQDNEPFYFKPQEDGSLQQLTKEEVKAYYDDMNESKNTEKINYLPKRRRRRNPMDYKSCSRCPIKYRFVAKLKEHMKTDHNIDMFYCKICKAIIEDEQEFNNHLKTHMNVHRCSICDAVFKKRDTIIAHIKSHEAMKKLRQSKGAHVCEICGWMLKDAESLKEHHEDKHVKKYTCYYCGRMYKGELSFDMHIKKHESIINLKQKRDLIFGKTDQPKEKSGPKKRRYTCKQCSHSFVDERALMWHERLHNDERPYTCDVCGRGFVSVNRRNQHALCAHTAPTRRCPLCPALFHLRSMVNTHIKKVHLQSHKRRRASKHQYVFWKTEPVPFQELSVDVQNDILELKSSQRERLRGDMIRRFKSKASSDLKEAENFLDYLTDSPGNASSPSLANYVTN